MRSNPAAADARYRVWITAYENWQPTGLDAFPPAATALEPAEEGTMSADQAAAYVTAFNRAASAAKQNARWAVALPVTIHYQGDAQAGQIIQGP
ncbi:MAG: hypothetical protein V3V75_00500 [Thermoguttaceae bacterium]